MRSDDRIIGAIEATQEFMDKRIDSLELKVDSLLEFKWKIYGATAIIATVCTVLIEGIARALAHN